METLLWLTEYLIGFFIARIKSLFMCERKEAIKYIHRADRKEIFLPVLECRQSYNSSLCKILVLTVWQWELSPAHAQLHGHNSVKSFWLELFWEVCLKQPTSPMSNYSRLHPHLTGDQSGIGNQQRRLAANPQQELFTLGPYIRIHFHLIRWLPLEPIISRW